MEKKGLVNRKKLLGFQGRSRKSQLALAQKYGLKNYPTPAGGCILTDKEYAKKLRELLKNVKKPKPSDLELLQIGRHFWAEKTHFILGRNHEENLKLKKLAESGDILMEPKDIPGPTALIRGKKDRKVLEEAKKMLLKYTKNAPKNIKTELIPI
jgi:predicted ribosome quality control (RQC) complex YloA/Tae2 family protein